MERQTHHQKLKHLFESNPNEWISLREIINLGIAMYPPRIKELRDEEKMIIENEVRNSGGVKHSYYKYVKYMSAPYQDTLPFARRDDG